MDDDARLTRANALYERAVFAGDDAALPAADRELDGVEADLALARGRVVHARFLARREDDPHELELFERACELYRRLGDVRGEGEATFWVGIYHQVVHSDWDTAPPFFERSYQLAVEAGDQLTMSYAARHLGFSLANDGDLAAARVRLEESVRLRREIGFVPGVAAGLLALADLAAQEGNADEARALLDEADDMAVSSGALGIRRWIAETRRELDDR